MWDARADAEAQVEAPAEDPGVVPERAGPGAGRLPLRGDRPHAQEPEVDRGCVDERRRDGYHEDGVERVAERGTQQQAREAEQNSDRRSAGGAAEDVEGERCFSPAHLDQGADLSDH